MQCLIYSRGELTGHADFAGFDPPMGVASGSFCPNENYKRISAIIREVTFLGSLTDTEATEKTRLHAQDVFRRLEALELKARTVAGEDLDLAGGVSITDFSEELEDDPYEVTLLGMTRDISEKYFHDAIQQYYGAATAER